MTTIPISQVVEINPSVVAGGGAPSRLSGLVVSQDAGVAPGQVLNFFAKIDVSNYFGASAPETVIADNYFPGIVNGGQLPYVLKFVRYASAATPAGAYGASLGALTLTELQALTGTLIVTMDGTLFTSSTINLAAATSFVSAATIMTSAFTSPTFAVTYDTLRNRFLLLSTTTGIAATSTDVSGTLAVDVGLASSAGAFIVTAGSAADTPATAMDRAVGNDVNWGTFTTAYLTTITDRLAYAAWNSGNNFQFLFVPFDLEAASISANNAASFGAQVFAAPYQGTLPLYGGAAQAGAVMGYAASINYAIANGRTTLAFRQFLSAPAATVSDLETAKALLSNHYTYIGAYANAANNYTIAYAGATSGEFLWADTYLDQIYLNRELQRAFFEALLAYNSLPYNSDGYTAMYRAGADVAVAAVTSGIIRQGVTLSQNQQQQVNTRAGGRLIAPNLQTVGWYLLITDPPNVAQARQNRTSPQSTFFYCDGGSIQQLTVGSVAVI